MISALVTIALFYAMLWVFERNRIQFDFYDVATAVVAPVIAAVLVALGMSFLGLGVWSGIASSLTLVVVTYLVLTKILTLSPGRAGIYTAAVLVLHSVPALLLSGLPTA